MTMIKLALWWLFRKIGMALLLLRFHPKSALRTLGWFRSFRARLPVDSAGKPIPWWTYPSIHFLAERINGSLRVLEFGCGYSTLWLSERAKEVIAVESHPGWAKRVSSLLGDNARVIVTPSLEVFARDTSQEIPRKRYLARDKESDQMGELFDILIIDAGNRIEIARHACKMLADTGVVIWDNTDGPDWPTIRDLMKGYRFREISFQGLISQELCLSRTTIFYRDDNCLGI